MLNLIQIIMDNNSCTNGAVKMTHSKKKFRLVVNDFLKEIMDDICIDDHVDIRL
jgi:hypothetical protein